MGRVQKQQGHTANPKRSCLCCHRRKVRCDRRFPCANCEKAGWTCAYPSGYGDDHKQNKEVQPSLQDITHRLERLEAMLSELVRNKTEFERPQLQPQPQTASVSASANGNNSRAGEARKNPGRPWEVLLGDGDGVQYVNNSNLLDLLPDVSRMPCQMCA